MKLAKLVKIGLLLWVCTMLYLPEGWCGCFRAIGCTYQEAESDITELQKNVPPNGSVAEKENGLDSSKVSVKAKETSTIIGEESFTVPPGMVCCIMGVADDKVELKVTTEDGENAKTGALGSDAALWAASLADSGISQLKSGKYILKYKYTNTSYLTNCTDIDGFSLYLVIRYLPGDPPSGNIMYYGLEEEKGVIFWDAVKQDPVTFYPQNLCDKDIECRVTTKTVSDSFERDDAVYWDFEGVGKFTPVGATDAGTRPEWENPRGSAGLATVKLSVRDDGEYVQDIADSSYHFIDQVDFYAIKCQFTVYAAWPKDHSHSWYSGYPTNVGHGWWEFDIAGTDSMLDPTLKPQVNKPVGYYPKVSSPVSVGEYACPDDRHASDEQSSRTCAISYRKLKAGLDYNYSLSRSPGTYNLFGNNCSDKAVAAGAAAGVSVPAPTCYLGTITCPGYMACDLCTCSVCLQIQQNHPSDPSDTTVK